MKSKVLAQPDVRAVLQEFVFAELYTDKGPHKDENKKLQDERFNSVALPLYLVLSPDGKELARLELNTGLATKETFIDFLRKGQKALGSTPVGP
jgi:hypothetical protein